MQNQNIKEFDEMRRQIVDVTGCTTKYISYILGGSGIGFFAMALQKGPTIGLALSALGLCLIIVLVLHFLFYKFNSHNRASGYSKLLSAEVWRNPPRDDFANILIFESCVDQLHLCESDPDKYIHEMSQGWEDGILLSEIKACFPRQKELSPKVMLQGFWLLMKSFAAKEHSVSWRFPIWVMMVFFILASIYLIIAISMVVFHAPSTWSMSNLLNYSLAHTKFAWVLIIFVIVQSLFWGYFFSKFYRLMKGESTIDSFFLKFLLCRKYVLKEYYDIDASYKRINPHHKSNHLLDKKGNLIDRLTAYLGRVFA